MEANRTVRKRRVNLVVIAVVLGALVNAFFHYLNRNFQMEDALIYYRYIENALAGKGLVYNEGERVNALSSPLYTYISLAFAAAIRNIHISQVILSYVLSTAWGVLLVFHLKDKIARPLLLLVPLVVTQHPYFFGVLGMETNLFILLCTLALVLFERRAYTSLAVVSSLLVITRGEGVFLPVSLVIEHVREGRAMPRSRWLVAPFLLLVASCAFTYSYYGSVVPHTLSAKVSQGMSGGWGAWPAFVRVKQHVVWFFSSSTLRAVLFLLLAGHGAFTERRTATFRAVALFLFLYTCFFVALNIPSYHWYHAPYYYFGSVYIIHGVGRALGKAKEGRGLFRAGRSVWAALCLLLTLWLSAGHTEHNLKALPLAGPPAAYTKIGRWMARHLEPDAKIAVMEIGTIGWYSKLYIIDMLGLVTPLNAEFVRHKRHGEWLNHCDPDYVLVHDPPCLIEEGALDRVARGAFEEYRSFRRDGFVLLRRVRSERDAG